MSITVSLNGKEIVCVYAKFTITHTSNSAKQFHDLARIAHHAIDKAFKDLSTVKLTVKQEGGAK